jgi:predicted dehydrogenase
MTTARPRWGIAATGHIAARFAGGLREAGCDIAAVASRDRGRAEAFGERFGIPGRHGSYEGLAADPQVDVVYVGSPHTRHAADTLLFLGAGKHVLCEKPFALSRAEAQRMVDAARAAGLFLMDAIWSRFLPGYALLREVLDGGRIGSPLVVDADLGFPVPFDPSHRLYDRAVGGGALLDLGVYPVQLVSLVLGAPDRVQGTGHVGSTGVDELVAGTLHHPGGALGVVRASITAPLACTARITGTEGWVELGRRMHTPPHLTVGRPGVTERIECAHTGEGLRFEALEVERCLGAGLTESPTMRLDETLTIMGTLDALRSTLGVTYPGEDGG